MLNNLLRYQGSAVFGMIGMVSGAVINRALDPLLFFTSVFKACHDDKPERKLRSAFHGGMRREGECTDQAAQLFTTA
ncbi:MAG: hypothetical protein LBG27_12370 [Spirochaetaceae bacterium]|jgi:hypothetical protein|nr:hypothetical protein [Spirochaetaceae bacterium]